MDVYAQDSSSHPSEVSQLTTLVMHLKDELATMKETQTKMMTLLEKMSENATAEKDMRIKAEEELKQMREKVTVQAKPVTPTAPPAPPKPSLLLGTSLLRNVDPKALDNFEVTAKGGALITDLHTALTQMPVEKQYTNIVIVCGSVDLEKDKTHEDIVSDFEAIMLSASLRADKTTVCGVLPRADKDLNEKRVKVNDGLRIACENVNATYIDMDNTFLLRNGNVNVAHLVQDGLHLSKHGVDILLRNCNIPLKTNVTSAFTNARYKQQTPINFKGHEHPFSNFYPISGFKMNGISFATSEAAYVYEKAMHHNQHNIAEDVRKTKTGIHAKRLGDRITTNSNWQRRKIDVMDNIIRAKVRICPDARKTLLESEDRELIEDTPHEFWGRGKTNKGENMLGKLWMLQREKLKNEDRKPTAQTWATRNQQPKCYRCSERGHLLEQCRLPEAPACWSCGRRGHKRKHCRNFHTAY